MMEERIMAKPAKKPVPDGYHTITASLSCRDAAGAIEFYKKALGAEEIERFSTPSGKVIHAEMKVGDSRIMLGEEMPGKFPSPLGLGGTTVGLYLYTNDIETA